MKKIHTDRIKELSNLVKLKLTSEELETLSVDLNDILDSFEKLNRLKINSFNEFDDDLKDKNIIDNINLIMKYVFSNLNYNMSQ